MSPTGKIHDFYWKKVIRFALLFTFILWVILDFALYRVHPFTCWYGNKYCFSTATLVALGCTLGYFAGRWVTPDLDLFGITHNEWSAVKKGKLLGLLFIMYWMPYGYFLKGKHRSRLSHSYVFSSLLRVIYLFFWSIFFIFSYPALQMILFGFFIGLSVSDALHIWLDFNYKEKK